ncbi:NADPH-dependent FMN reductase [Streptosporangium sp. NPDC048047]|uniref:NADPH-dependent FMN reductase n=1 Tax=Streptosporangium sp. NPDC048047 TaxID=3155748 RepID=UPI0034300F20
MKIIGIAGGLRPGAYVGRLLEASGRELPASVGFDTWEGLEEVPPFEDGPLPGPVEELCRALSAADGVLIAAPAHSDLPPQLRHALDWAASGRGGAVLVDKPVGVVTACLRPYEAIWTQIELRRALGAAGAVVHGVDLPVSPAAGRFDEAGRVADPELRNRLRQVLRHLCAAPQGATVPQPSKPLEPSRTPQPSEALQLSKPSQASRPSAIATRMG